MEKVLDIELQLPGNFPDIFADLFVLSPRVHRHADKAGVDGGQHDEEKISGHLLDDALKCTKRRAVKSLHKKINEES